MYVGVDLRAEVRFRLPRKACDRNIYIPRGM